MFVAIQRRKEREREREREREKRGNRRGSDRDAGITEKLPLRGFRVGLILLIERVRG